jgi:hypothetical protein
MAMLGALGDLVLSLSADTARFQSDLGRANRAAEKFTRDVGRTLNKLAGVFVALGGAAGLTGLVTGQIDAADAAGKMSQRVGVGVEKLQEYMLAARLADLSNEQLQVGLQQLAKNQADFVNGTGEAADAFRALGISQEQVKKLNGDTAALFELVAGKLSGFEDGANKTAIAMKILGRSGAEMIPFINSLDETRERVRQVAEIAGKDAVDAAERFNDNLTLVGISVQAMGMNIAKDLLPTLELMSAAIVDNAKEAKKFSLAGQGLKAFLQVVAVVGANVSFVLKGMGRELAGMAAQLAALARLDFKGFAVIREELVRDGEIARAELDAFEAKIMGTAASVEKSAPATAKKLASPMLKAAEDTKKAQDEMRAAIMRVHDDAMNAALADQEIERRRVEQVKQGYDSLVESAELVVQAADDMVYTWDAAGNRIAMTKEEFASVGRAAGEFGRAIGDSFGDAIVRGEELDDVLKKLAISIARMILEEQVSKPIAAAFSGALSGIFAGAGGSMAGAAVTGVPAYASGTDYVPRTGLALVHQGERITPAGQSGGGTYMIDARGADRAGLMRLEAVIRQLNGSIEHRAVSAVAMAKGRGQI